MPTYSQQPWPSRGPEGQEPSDLAQTVDSVVLHAVQRIRVLRVPGAVDSNGRRRALLEQRAELVAWLPLIADGAWLSKESVEQIISALERPDGSVGEQAAVTARIEGAVAGTLIPAFPGVTQHDVDLIAALRSGRHDRQIRSEYKKIQDRLKPDSPAIREAVADHLGSYLDPPFETAVIFLKTAWGVPYQDGTFKQAELGKPSAEVSFAKQQIAVGGVAGLTHLYTWR